MLPVKALRLSIGEAMAADAAFLAPAVNANKLALVKTDFVLSEDLVVDDLDLADFDGSPPISGATGTQLAGIDPLTGQQVVEVKEPLGGWRWETTGVTNLPQTIYGYALVKSDLSVLYAIGKFPQRIGLTTAGQFVEVDNALLTLVLQPVE